MAKSPKKWNRSSAFSPEDFAFVTALQTVVVTRTLRAIRRSTAWSPDEMLQHRGVIGEALNRLTKMTHDGIFKILKGE